MGHSQLPSVTSVVSTLRPSNASDLTNGEATGIPGTVPPSLWRTCNIGVPGGNERAFVGQALVEKT